MGEIQEGFITLNYVPTHVMTWGGWIEDASLADHKEIIVLFPGNPGVITFYSEFLQHLHDSLKIPVWVIAHAGHEQPPHNRLIPNLEKNKHLYDVEGQIKNKKELIQRFVPKGCKVHLVGHSAGGFMALDLLKEDAVADIIQGSYLLFPVLENIGKTPNGQFLQKVVSKILGLIYLAAGFFMILPQFVKLFLLAIHFRVAGIIPSPMLRHSILILLNPKNLRAVFNLAIDEIAHIKDLDADLINKRKDKIFVYYGDHDNWAPVSHYERLVKAVPGVQAEICKKGIDHAFMLYKPPSLMAGVVCDLISNNRVK